MKPLPNIIHGIPSLFERAYLLNQMMSSSGHNIIITDGYLTSKKIARHLSDLGRENVTIVENESSYEKVFIDTSETFIATLDIFFQTVPDHKMLNSWSFEVTPGDTYKHEVLIDRIIGLGYEHSLDQSAGTYCLYGDTLRVYSQDDMAIHISTFGDQIESIIAYQGERHKELPSVRLSKIFAPLRSLPLHIQTDFHTSIAHALPDTTWFFLGIDLSDHDIQIIEAFPDAVYIQDLPSDRSQSAPSQNIHIANLSDLKSYLETHHHTVEIFSKHPKAIETFLAENSLKKIPLHTLSELMGESFAWSQDSTIMETQLPTKQVISDDILSRLFVRKRSRLKTKQRLDLLVQIKPGDYIVHLFHGVGIFENFIKKDLSGVTREYLEIRYADDDRLFVPIEEVHRISKYIGGDHPTLTRLGKLEWKKTLARTQREIEDIADQLISEHAKRQLEKGFAFSAFEDKEQAFSDAFGFDHTLDQQRAISDIYDDMGSDLPMDRLLSGDVGFGKTEVAFHAIYRAFLNAKQTLFIAPLVVLAYEHYDSALTRLKAFGIKVDILTRLSTSAEVTRALKDLKDGKTHVLIGTHRLLSPDIKCLNLGLMVVDEEHKFGVKDKERIVHMKTGVDTLSLSATPIPRSLNLALSGVKQFSILTTPPRGKEPIKTIVTDFSEQTVAKAIHQELDRGGKVFYVYNRVQTIASMKQTLEKIIGNKARIIITHGQMSGIELEDNIIEFKTGNYNILLTTTVIENGINFLDTNTIVIHDAQQFGLAQLHQLRGRVGRGKIHGYCYLMYGKSELSADARERLVTIANNAHLGAGFEIAMRDMQMRGVGEILGVKQSGKTQDVGVSFYLKLLEQRIEELKEGKPPASLDCKIDLGISYFVPDDFFTSGMDKIHFYRHLESVTDQEELTYLYQKMIEDHDQIPIELENLFLLSRARIFFRSVGMVQVKQALGNYIFLFKKDNNPDFIRAFLNADKDQNVVLISMEKAQISQRAFPSAIALLEYFVA